MAIEDRTQGVFTEQRPWGDFRSFCQNESATVKVITVQPGQRLSLQKHAQRAEMWTNLDETPMEVTVDERTFLLARDEQVWIPQGAVHRMANPGEQPARILEVGFGNFDEDDIVRLEDDYQRD